MNGETGYQTEQNAGDSYGYYGNPFEEMSQGLCQNCRRRTIDRSENPESVLCRECREEMIKLKVPKSIIITCIVVAAVVIFGMGIFVMDFFRGRTEMSSWETAREEEFEEEEEIEEADYNSKKNGDIRNKMQDDPACSVYTDMAAEGKVVSALDGMLTELEEDPDNLQMAITLADVAMEYSYPDYAAYAINEYLVDEMVSDEEYDRIVGYIEELEVYYDTCDELDFIWEAVMPAEDEDSEEIDVEAVFKEYHDEVKALLSEEGYDQALLYYDLYYSCMDEEEGIQHLKDCIAINDCYFDAQAQLAVYYRRNGDLEEARKILEEVYVRNKEDYSVLRAYATLELAEGNLEQGLAYAEKAYNMYADGDYVIDTYLIALMANGQQEEADELLLQYEDEGYYFDEDFYEFQMGGMTLEEYYIGE